MVAGTTPPAAPEPELLVGGDEDRPHRRRWPWLLLALAVLAALAVRPVLGHLNTAGLGDLQGLWAERTDDDLARGTALARLESAALPTDAAAARRAAAALGEEEAARLGALRQRMDDLTLVDGSLRAVRAAMVTALTAEMADLRSAAASGTLDQVVTSGQTSRAIGRAQAQLAAARQKYRVTASASPPRVTLHAADATIARFQRYLDTPTGGLRLLVANGSDTALLDVDASRISDLPFDVPTAPGSYPSAEAGQLVGTSNAGSGLAAYAMPGTLDEPARILGQGAAIPAPGRNGVWLVDNTGVSLVDLTGRILLPPTALPPGAAPTGVALYAGAAVRAGLVLFAKTGGGQIPTGLIVWDPLIRRTVRTVTTGCAQVLASGQDLLAWLPTPCHPTGDLPPAALHLYDTATGDDRTVAGTDRVYAADVPMGAFSPDARHLAMFQIPAGGDYQLSIVDVTTATTWSVLATSQSDQYGHPPIWSPDSTRVFYDAGGWSGPTGVGQPRELLASYRVGDPAVADLRLPHNPDRLLAVLGAG